jgi:hypothetical protein
MKVMDADDRQESVLLLRIGRREHIEFPEWDLDRIRAKIDTGAYSSVLDVADYELVESASGLEVALRILPNRRRPEHVRTVRTAVVGLTTVRSSTGCQERRPVIEPLVRLGPITRRIRLTVTNRSHMRCRMLIGRQALAGVFLVDVGGKDLLARA